MHWGNRVYLFSQSSHDQGIYKVAAALTLSVKVGLNNFLLSEIFLNHRSLHKEEKKSPFVNRICEIGKNASSRVISKDVVWFVLQLSLSHSPH